GSSNTPRNPPKPARPASVDAGTGTASPPRCRHRNRLAGRRHATPFRRATRHRRTRATASPPVLQRNPQHRLGAALLTAVAQTQRSSQFGLHQSPNDLQAEAFGALQGETLGQAATVIPDDDVEPAHRTLRLHHHFPALAFGEGVLESVL